MTDRQPRRNRTNEDRSRDAARSMMLLCKEVHVGRLTPDELYERMMGLAPTVVELVEVGQIAVPAGWDDVKPKKVVAVKPTKKAATVAKKAPVQKTSKRKTAKAS